MRTLLSTGLFFLLACSGPSDKSECAICGEWYAVEYDGKNVIYDSTSMTFFPDSTFTMMERKFIVKGSWSLSSDQTKMTLTPHDYSDPFEWKDIRITGDTLSLYSNGLLKCVRMTDAFRKQLEALPVRIESAICANEPEYNWFDCAHDMKDVGIRMDCSNDCFQELIDKQKNVSHCYSNRVAVIQYRSSKTLTHYVTRDRFADSEQLDSSLLLLNVKYNGYYQDLKMESFVAEFADTSGLVKQAIYFGMNQAGDFEIVQTEFFVLPETVEFSLPEVIPDKLDWPDEPSNNEYGNVSGSEIDD